MKDDQFEDIGKALKARFEKAQAEYDKALRELEDAEKKMAARKRELDLANERVKSEKH